MAGPSSCAVRTRIISASNSLSSRVEPEPEALHKSDDADAGGGRTPRPDSAGLLSTGPSPRASVAGMRRRRGMGTGGVCFAGGGSGTGEAASFGEVGEEPGAELDPCD